MKIIDIDIEALIETISQEDDNLGKSFLDTYTGEVIYIPTEVSLALEKGTLKEDIFDNWLKEFVSVAILISEDTVNRYLNTPLLDEDFYTSTMNKYVNSVAHDSDLKQELRKVLNGKEPIKKFKHVLMDKPNKTEEWYKYEDNCINEFARTWLKSIGIELKYLN
ncbi:UPF0158 family protein [Clostridium tagluense]|uniref:UPF0158 family protein n=1 Tax=Clostridium TaxID=1485 RepID=UPI0013E93847|nr:MULTISPECIES: UPF0158 family protein [Clostridium]MBW9156621.1 UPF0158 family protein [Clostridium tagluense]MBZ9624989.1 UPF0158 family protein [Clostridium sp. FP2]MCB2311732.1 UPF0158 family protein [Clostridium tagluense]MCB2316546.1 UPF0158 family protein [Clostridium tagluense]MCB2321312.1 UPF0158 family protein [Clostridium tagluense]